MRLTAVDEQSNLYLVEQLVSQPLCDMILSTPWLDLPWESQDKQQSWTRRSVLDEHLPWSGQWQQELDQQWTKITTVINNETTCYLLGITRWWVDLPGFRCNLHTDGELPGSIHMMWYGAAKELGTTFYNFKHTNSVRYRFPMIANHGYVMVNRPDDNGYRCLQWHGMTEPIPANTYRLTSYTPLACYTI